MKYLKTYEENKKKKDNEAFDRSEFYLEYFKNLAPKGFKVKKKNNDIIISVK